MHTSAEGIAFLERHEGVVLKAYRDPVGIWTIGAGLTKASGVVTPKAGMKITRPEASAMLSRALRNNYEPRVLVAMPRANQFEFDGGVSFDWNTGAIHRASWVAAWRAGKWGEVASKIRLWRKGGGRVLPGLVRRREEEFLLIRDGNYGSQPVPQRDTRFARIVVSLTEAELAEIHSALALLGYDPSADRRGISAAAVVSFQADHDLTVDGIIGRATLSTLQRRLDARSKVKTTTNTTATGAAVSGGAGAAEAVPLDIAVGIITVALIAGILAALYLAWTYRDAVAVKVQTRFPKLAQKLRGI
ncbi:glycoside hydrolase family protein [Roseobacter sp. YSTF-M11]|uniref:Lysozyme n=1 Tax=Roseobacter insulae TaxID=2859783 RepID=A0A9X1JYY0_9RHOB|nr:glycoside hydrolase family protein [Roseobacter insulae]MBW4708645.1 glycoside hydrolase family protein [Roseobacter insulae]